MEGKNKATEAANKKLYKDSLSCRNIQKVRQLFLTGKKYTAKQLNQDVGFNDARKAISTLRNKEKWNIQDVRQADGCKSYWLVQNDGQLSLFEEGGWK